MNNTRPSRRTSKMVDKRVPYHSGSPSFGASLRKDSVHIVSRSSGCAGASGRQARMSNKPLTSSDSWRCRLRSASSWLLPIFTLGRSGAPELSTPLEIPPQRRSASDRGLMCRAPPVPPLLTKEASKVGESDVLFLEGARRSILNPANLVSLGRIAPIWSSKARDEPDRR